MKKQKNNTDKTGIKPKDLPKPAKVSATHSLKDIGFSIRKIAKILGIGHMSVQRYLKEIPDEEWSQFGHNVKKLISVKEDEIAAKCLKEIEDKMPRARFYELVGLYKTIKDTQAKAPATAVQINFNQQIQADKEKYGL